MIEMLISEIKALIRKRNAPSLQEQTMFFRQLKRFYKAGIPIPDALQNIYEGTDNQQFKEIIREMIVQLRNGNLLSSAMRDSSLFPPFCINAIYAAEEVGSMDEVFEEITNHYDQAGDVARQLKSGLMPVKFFSVMSLIAMCLGIFVVIPKFAEVLRDLKADLPLASAMVMNMGTFFLSHWLFVLILAVSAVVGSVYWVKTYPEKYDRFLLHVPIYSTLYRLELQYRFTKILALVSKGVAIGRGMELAAAAVDHIPMQKVLNSAAREIKCGSETATALELYNQEGFISKDTITMIRAGEKSSQLVEILDEISADYRKDLLCVTKTVGDKLGLMVIIPTMSLLIALFGCAYYPIITMMGAIHR